ncbi:MAG: cytochrome c biogenesis protein CcsA [Gammaproteobacteria bacterium]|nr:cytochrome c biogenesis protein CcsA [Gammaproteobacteria bacterium]
MLEQVCLLIGVASYATAALCVPAVTAARSDVRVRLTLTGLGLGVLALAMTISARWLRIGHGPFLTLFEILLSNLFSLGLVYALAYWRRPAIRPGALIALPVLALLGVWTLLESPEPTALPASYDNLWLWVHVLAGKLFLGALLVSAGLAGGLLLARVPQPVIEDADTMVWRWLGLAFVFQSLMLLAGAAWAQDAWGRYWSWDPLETWAFLVWLCVGASLHQRLTYTLPERVEWACVVVIFVLALVTFLGVPFLSVAPHKGIA